MRGNKFGKWTKVYFKKVLKPLLRKGSVSELSVSQRSASGFTRSADNSYRTDSKLIEEFIEDIDNILHAQIEDWQEILEVLKEEYEERLEK